MCFSATALRSGRGGTTKPLEMADMYTQNDVHCYSMCCNVVPFVVKCLQ